MSSCWDRFTACVAIWVGASVCSILILADQQELLLASIGDTGKAIKESIERQRLKDEQKDA